MDSVFNSVVFPPQCGGQHLALMLSTAYINDPGRYLEIYNSMDKNVDEWSSVYTGAPVKSYHIQRFTTKYTQVHYPYQRVFLFKVATNADSTAYKRMTKNLKFMDNPYFIELVNMLYSVEYISKIHNIPEHHIHSIDTEEFFQSDISAILDRISQLLPINVELCRNLHSIWLSKILNNLQT